LLLLLSPAVALQLHIAVWKCMCPVYKQVHL